MIPKVLCDRAGLTATSGVNLVGRVRRFEISNIGNHDAVRSISSPTGGQAIPPAPLGDGRGEVPGGDLGARNMRSNWRQFGGDRGGSPGWNRSKHSS
jgi:hypothetical protein